MTGGRGDTGTADAIHTGTGGTKRGYFMQEYDDPNHEADPTGSGLLEWGVDLGEWLHRIFKCWHRHMGWPITSDGETYRVCLDCGARRRFIAESWRTVGGFYWSGADGARSSRTGRRSTHLQSAGNRKPVYRTQTLT